MCSAVSGVLGACHSCNASHTFMHDDDITIIPCKNVVDYVIYVHACDQVIIISNPLVYFNAVKSVFF